MRNRDRWEEGGSELGREWNGERCIGRVLEREEEKERGT